MAAALALARVLRDVSVLWALARDGADGVQDLPAGITADLAHAIALAGARTLTGAAGGDGTHDSA